MYRFKAALLALMCFLCVLLLTGCYTNPDPWPSSSAPTEAPAAVTETAPGGNAPVQEPAPTAAPGLNG